MSHAAKRARDKAAPCPAGGCTGLRGFPFRESLALAMGLVGLLVAGGAAAQSEIRIDDFAKTLAPNELAEGWDSRKISPTFGDGDLFFFQFVHDNGGQEHWIHLKSGNDNSFTVGSQRSFRLQDYPVLEWEWKVVTLPTNGDVRVKARDDQAGSLCVVHDPGLIGFDSLCYIWENKGPKGTEVTSTKRDDSKYIILRAGDADPLDKWQKERRNIYEDFKRLFGREPDKEAVIGIQIDSDSTESAAEAYYRNIFLKKS